jgi:hypothetical protein
MEEISKDEYRVTYDAATTTVAFYGKLRLYGWAAYQPIEGLLRRAIAGEPEVVTLDVSELEFMNSTGIDMLYRFAHKVSGHAGRLAVRRSKLPIPWQRRLISTLEMMAPNLTVVLTDEEPEQSASPEAD